jgi:hypothetical protein
MASRTLSVVAVAACLLLPVSATAEDVGGAEALRTSKATASSEITFMGYRSGASGSGTLFVELTDTVVVEVNHNGPVVEYKMMGTRVPLKNNKNPLLLREFDSSALSAVLVPGKKAVSLVVTLRGKVSPQHRMVARGKGAVLEVDLPALAK